MQTTKQTIIKSQSGTFESFVAQTTDKNTINLIYYLIKVTIVHRIYKESRLHISLKKRDDPSELLLLKASFVLFV